MEPQRQARSSSGLRLVSCIHLAQALLMGGASAGDHYWWGAGSMKMPTLLAASLQFNLCQLQITFKAQIS